LFLASCDEVADLDWTVALKQLVVILDEIKIRSGKTIASFIEKQLYNWLAALPSYIKAYLPISCWSSRGQASQPVALRHQTSAINAFGSSKQDLLDIMCNLLSKIFTLITGTGNGTLQGTF
jgi:hypothetical protein